MLLLEGMQLLLISLNTAYFFSNFMDSDGLPQGFLYWINSNLHSNCNRFNFSSPSAVLLHEQKHQYFTSHSILQKQENKPIKAGLLHKYATYLNQCIPARIFIVFSNSKKKPSNLSQVWREKHRNICKYLHTYQQVSWLKLRHLT